MRSWLRVRAGRLVEEALVALRRVAAKGDALAANLGPGEEACDCGFRVHAESKRPRYNQDMSASRITQAQRDKPERIAEGRWRMWAEARLDGKYMQLGGRYTVALDRMGRPAEVLVRETIDGPYWGWLASGEEIPSNVRLDEAVFRAYFRDRLGRDGLDAEMQRRHGRVVRLAIEPWSEAALAPPSREPHSI